MFIQSVFTTGQFDFPLPSLLPSLDLYILDVRESPVMESAAEIPDGGCLSVEFVCGLFQKQMN